MTNGKKKRQVFYSISTGVIDKEIKVAAPSKPHNPYK